MTRYAKPASLDEALSLLGEAPWRVLAGGTDFYPSQGARPIRDNVLDINGLAELRGISAGDGFFRIGARTIWTDVIRADMPPAFDGLKAAAREVGSIQIQNVGTVAGNLCNASPAADGVPALMTLDAEVEVMSRAAIRRLPLSGFILGNRKTALMPGELVTALVIPKASADGSSAFVKLGARRYLVISIGMVAARVVVEQGLVAKAAVAIGACSAVAVRLTSLERDLAGRPANAALADIVAAEHLADLSPIDDVRGSAGYRLEAARELIARAIAVAIAGTPAGRAAA